MIKLALGTFISLFIVATAFQAVAQSVEKQNGSDTPGVSVDRADAPKTEDCKGTFSAIGLAKFRPFTKTKELEGNGSAMESAVATWESVVGQRFGDRWGSWSKAKNKRFECAASKSDGKIMGSSLVECTIWGRPCADGPALNETPPPAQVRIALIITNQAYRLPGSELANTHRDGEILKDALETVGFKVWVTKDTANEGQMLLAIGEHVQRLVEAGPGAIGFLYYSGHGAADRPNGENYLIPTEVPLTHAAQLPLMGVRLERIISALTEAGRMSFIVFDACRNVPLQRAEKSTFKGFAPVGQWEGLLIAFATAPGNVAIDNNFYAKALAEELVKPGQEAGQTFLRVRQRVRLATQQRQSPEVLDKRDDVFHFAVAPPAKR